MFQHILVISDNLFLCQQIEEILLRHISNAQTIDFSISPFSNLEQFQQNLKSEISVYNLKEERAVDEIIGKFDLVISIHCKQIFPQKLVESVRCINVHPGYNPINRGWYPQVFSIINDLPVGATIHEIDEQLDHGPIIARAFVEKNNYETSGDLYDKILEKEVELFEKNISSILQNTYQTFLPEDEGNVFYKSDFNALREINLEENLKAHDFIKKLRALTHKDYKNAYFIDPDTGRKVYVSINLSPEE